MRFCGKTPREARLPPPGKSEAAVGRQLVPVLQPRDLATRVLGTDADAVAQAPTSEACLLEACREAQLAPETVSRGFHRAIGVTPKTFRIESRARRAWNLLLRSSSPLSDIAVDLGFSDLAHLSRAVGALTGAPPSYWRQHGVAESLAGQVHSS